MTDRFRIPCLGDIQVGETVGIDFRSGWARRARPEDETIGIARRPIREGERIEVSLLGDTKDIRTQNENN